MRYFRPDARMTGNTRAKISKCQADSEISKYLHLFQNKMPPEKSDIREKPDRISQLLTGNNSITYR